MKVCVIGAGLAGIAAVRELAAAGLDDVTVYDTGASIGGMWNGGSSMVWEGLRLNTSRRMTELSNAPMEASMGSSAYVSAAEYTAYLEKCVDDPQLRSKFKLRHRVTSVRKQGGAFKVLVVDLGTGRDRSESFDRVVVASGMFSTPNKVTFPDRNNYKGKIVHSMKVRGTPVRDKTVVILGSGITGADLAATCAARGAKSVVLCCRTPSFVVPKLIQGHPTDTVINKRMNVWLVRAFPEPLMNVANVKMLQEFSKDFSDVKRDERLEDDVVKFGIMLSQRYLEHVRAGRIVEKPLPVKAGSDSLVFPDDTVVKPDVVFDCGGYRCKLPYLSDALQKSVLDEGTPYCLNLYKWTFHPDEPDMGFVGLVRVSGGIGPVAEMQARWIAAVFSGKVKLPPADEMRKDMAANPALQGEELHNRRALPQAVYLDTLAEKTYCAPAVFTRPLLFPSLVTKPMYPVQFRVDGPHSDPSAFKRLKEYYRVPDNDFFNGETGDEDQYQSAFLTL